MVDAVTGQTTPGTLGTEYNVLAFVFQQLLQKVQTLSLVKVISCTNNGGVTPVGRVVVQPLVFQITGGGTIVPHGQIADVPYLRIQGGTNAVILDPQPGDIGLAGFCSRDIANVKADPQGAVANGGAPPGSFGVFDWADGVYLGGFLNGVPVQYVQFSAAGITVVSPTKITLQAPTVEVDASTLFKVAAGVVDIEAVGDAKLVGNTVEVEAVATVSISGAAIDAEATGNAKLAGNTTEIEAVTAMTVSGATVGVAATGVATVSGAMTNVEATGTATVQGVAIDLAGPVSQTGGGSATFSGSINTPTGDVTAQGTSLHTHKHGPGTYVAGSTPVSGTAGVPI